MRALRLAEHLANRLCDDCPTECDPVVLQDGNISNRSLVASGATNPTRHTLQYRRGMHGPAPQIRVARAEHRRQFAGAKLTVIVISRAAAALWRVVSVALVPPASRRATAAWLVDMRAASSR